MIHVFSEHPVQKDGRIATSGASTLEDALLEQHIANLDLEEIGMDGEYTVFRSVGDGSIFKYGLIRDEEEYAKFMKEALNMDESNFMDMSFRTLD